MVISIEKLYYLCRKNNIETESNMLDTLLCNNHKLMSDSGKNEIFIKEPYDRGIRFIRDIVKENGELLTLNELNETRNCV